MGLCLAEPYKNASACFKEKWLCVLNIWGYMPTSKCEAYKAHNQTLKTCVV